MKISIIAPGLSLGGAENSLIKLIRIIYPKSVCLELIILSRADNAMLDRLPDGVLVRVINAQSSASPLAWLKVGIHIRKLKPDLIIGWSTYANLVAVVASYFSRNSRLILSERNYIPKMYGSETVSTARRKLVLKLIKLMYAKADVITANSYKNIHFLKKYVGFGPCYRLLPNVYNSSSIDGSPGANLHFDSHEDMRPRFLAVGRLVSQKGFDVLLQAFALVNRQQPEWKMHIVGDGPEREALYALSASLSLTDVVVWHGEDRNPFPYYRWADIVVVPSRFEGFPNVPLEAMGEGKAVICSNCKSGPAELLENGKYGVLTPVGDAKALADAMIELGLSKEKVADFGRRAREHVLDQYGPQRIKAVYEDVLGLSQ